MRSHVFEHIFEVGKHGQLRKKTHPVLESTYGIRVELNPSLIPICAITNCYTDSYKDILYPSRYPTKLRW
jgi:hypothetical protein